MLNLLQRIRKFGIGRFLLFVLVLLLIPGFILTVTLMNNFTPDELFAHAGDKDIKTLVYIPTELSDIMTEDGSSKMLAESGDSMTWIGGAENPTKSVVGIKFTGTKLPAGSIIKSAFLELYSTQSQWVKVNLEIYTEAAITINTFGENSLPSARTLSVAKDSFANDVKWDNAKYYEINVTKSVTEYLATVNPQATEIGLIIKNVLPTQWGRRFFSTNIDNPSKVPTLMINYTTPGNGSSKGI